MLLMTTCLIRLKQPYPKQTHAASSSYLRSNECTHVDPDGHLDIVTSSTTTATSLGDKQPISGYQEEVERGFKESNS
ncbi:hypothetical protein TorRG33x02_038450 [Trema orientale]|uniref:Uncharacterized protein n=1 Tax=Trema orientale TaxID=63057 RepID=A0A2P5FRP7_TREOI|nr:hypothetical protein TorRG33x02_038450 [Trema orientale]